MPSNVSISRRHQDQFLYYAREVEPTFLMPLNKIATEQTKSTEKTQAATEQLLDYLAKHPDTAIRYRTADMILHIHIDALYLSDSNPAVVLEVSSFAGTNHRMKMRSMDPSSTQLLS
jgi:hypothetical protein